MAEFVRKTVENEGSKSQVLRNGRNVRMQLKSYPAIAEIRLGVVVFP